MFCHHYPGLTAVYQTFHRAAVYTAPVWYSKYSRNHILATLAVAVTVELHSPSEPSIFPGLQNLPTSPCITACVLSRLLIIILVM